MSHTRKRKKIPGTMRVGVALLILGAIIVGLGTYMNREGLSIYGFVIVVCGFILYFSTILYMRKQEREQQRDKEKQTKSDNSNKNKQKKG